MPNDCDSIPPGLGHVARQGVQVGGVPERALAYRERLVHLTRRGAESRHAADNWCASPPGYTARVSLPSSAMSGTRITPVAHLDVSVPRYKSSVHQLALVSAPPGVPAVKSVLFENEGPGVRISGASPDGEAPE
ncbi:hypothetical protein DL771_000812 [Monosporascus sp. 5C6A]|nr:hypothetical protein DL771_000812 [Monosporascus sp. 5C6A]